MIWYCQILNFAPVFFFSLFSPFDFLPHLQTLWLPAPQRGGGTQSYSGLLPFVSWTAGNRQQATDRKSFPSISRPYPHSHEFDHILLDDRPMIVNMPSRYIDKDTFECPEPWLAHKCPILLVEHQSPAGKFFWRQNFELNLFLGKKSLFSVNYFNIVQCSCS